MHVLHSFMIEKLENVLVSCNCWGCIIFAQNSMLSWWDVPMFCSIKSCLWPLLQTEVDLFASRPANPSAVPSTFYSFFPVMNQLCKPRSRLQNLIHQTLMSTTHLLQFRWTILMVLIFLVHSLVAPIQLLQNQQRVLAVLTMWMGSLWQAPILDKRRVFRWNLECGQIH